MLWQGGGLRPYVAGTGKGDEEAHVVVAAAGPVVTDPTVPVFLGATGHTNNTGELTGLIEGMLWALHQDTEVGGSCPPTPRQ